MFDYDDEINDYIKEMIYPENLTFDPFVVAENNGIDVEYVSFLDKPYGLYVPPINMKARILISSDLKYSNMRFFVCAHELYHSIEHKYLAAYYTSIPGGQDSLEREANSFGTNLMCFYYKELFDTETISYVDVINYFEIPREIYVHDY